MPKLITGSELSELLANTVASDQRVQMVVAFWGAGAMQGLKLENHPNAQLICNLTSGGTNPHEIRKLMKAGLSVRMHNRLHAKVGIVGDQFSFVGSSNMSANGLGFEGSETAFWEEANIVFDGIESNVLARFDQLWCQSKEIGEDDLKRAEENWGPRRVFATLQTTGKVDQQNSQWGAINGQSERLRSLPWERLKNLSFSA